MPILHTSPHIEIVDDFATADECRHFRRISDGKFERALVSSTSGGIVGTGRTGSNCWITHKHDEVVKALCQRIADYVAMPLINAESVQVVHYGPTQCYNRHYDGWDFIESEKNRRCLGRGGQRLITCLVYLNEPIKGGTTDFPRLGISVQPKLGRMLVFHNVHAGTTDLHVNSEHAGMPVIEGEKYAFNLWFRQQEATSSFTYIAKNIAVAEKVPSHATEFDPVADESK
jgi:prolyl 4-hydroxylase